MAFKYQRRDAGAWDKRANQRGGDFVGIVKDDYQMYQVEKGDNFIRILPPTWENPEHYGIDVYIHYGVGPDNGSVLCLAKGMKQEKCPICEARARAERAGDTELKDELTSRKSVLVWMINRKDEKKGPMVWRMPWTLDRDITKICKDPRTGELYMIDDPENGYDVSFEKQGDQLTTKYVGIQIARRPSSVDQDFLDYVVECPLPETLMWLEYDDIQKLFEGGGTGEEKPKEKEPERREEPQRASNGDDREQARPASGFRPRGQASSNREEPRQTAPEDDEIPDRQANSGNGREQQQERRADPPPRDDPPPSGKTRAQELKERFGRR
jgi:hypothetical protein